MAGEGEHGDALGALDEPMLRALIAAMPAYVARVDADGCIRYVNNLRGDVPVDRVIGRSIFEVVDPADADAVRACFERVRSTGEVGRYAATARESGVPRAYECHVSALEDPDGRTG